MTFGDFKFSKGINEGLDAMGFDNPTPIQEKAIPPILKKQDLIGCAQTGTGKTAAYILPLLEHISNETSGKGKIHTLVLAPTRELAMQIDQHFEGFSYFVPVSSIPVYGGGDGLTWDQQKTALIKGADMIIATPGRLLAHIQMKYVDFSSVRCLVLDEADRMLDMGFYDDIMKIVTLLPRQRQTLMFSATMPHEIRQLAKRIMIDPVQIDLGIAKPAEGIIQGLYLLSENQKLPLVKQLLQGKKLKSILVFGSTKIKVKTLEREMRNLGFKVRAIHSDLEQKEREDVLLKFRNRKIQMLVATDIISRGIDITDIDLVINFDIPNDPEDYVHRVGRTARAESTGVALTFVTKKDGNILNRIETLIGYKIHRMNIFQ
ncbi:MAG: DEAD/DEAH box helicase [Bacteroidetes bacterium]|nr:DEAD/DEAH box helicase [Bacteroidota bacterium]